jgi:hypothetical protein
MKFSILAIGLLFSVSNSTLISSDLLSLSKIVQQNDFNTLNF